MNPAPAPEIPDFLRAANRGKPEAPKAHAKLSASGSERWMNCPGSVRASAGVEGTSSSYALEGTAAHALGEHCLKTGESPHEHIGKTWGGEGGIVCTDEMADAVQVYLDAVEAEHTPGSDMETEVRLDLGEIYPGMFGTADCCIYRPETQHLTVIDYKHGAGVAVDVLDNSQLLYYAVGRVLALRNRGVKTVRLMVVQPRCHHKDGPVRFEDVDTSRLLDFVDDLAKAAKLTEAPDAPLVVGEWCRWCPVAGTCPALHDKALAAAQADFGGADIDMVGDENMNLPEVARMTPTQLAHLLAQAGTIEMWLKAVREHAMAEALAGRVPTGHKLVHGKSNRKWANETEVAETLQLLGFDDAELMTAPEIKSPAQVEAAIKAAAKNGRDRKAAKAYADSGKDAVAGLVIRPLGGLTLVPDTDPRPPATPDAASQFAPV